MRKISCILLALILVFGLTVSVSAAGMPYVMDDSRLLTDSQRSELNSQAQSISDTYGIGVYIVTVDDFWDLGYGFDVYDAAWNLYHDRQLGCGTERQGMLLLMSMSDRDYALFFYGGDTEYAFGTYAQEQLENEFLDDFAYDDWYGGFRDYLDRAEYTLRYAAEGEPVRESPVGMIGIFVLIGCGIAGIMTAVQWAKMANVKVQRSADSYITPASLKLTRQTDQFLHRTRRRRHVPRSNSGSHSVSRSGGGGSGRSGKF